VLVLTRRLGEEILIDGRRIVLTILEVRSGQVKIGFQAPREVSINRGEVQRRIDLEEAGHAGRP
jgi:carbon storage regulator